MDLYQITVGSILAVTCFMGVSYFLYGAINTWKLVQFSCDKQCCYPAVFAICPHGGTPTDMPCPHHNI